MTCEPGLPEILHYGNFAALVCNNGGRIAGGADGLKKIPFGLAIEKPTRPGGAKVQCAL